MIFSTKISLKGKQIEKLHEAVINENIKRILLVRCQKIGDMITFLPTIMAVHQILPKAHITLLCSKDGVEIVKRIPFVEAVMIENINEIKKHVSYDLMITSSQDAGKIKLKKILNVKFAIGGLPELLKGVCLKHRWQYRYFTDTYKYSNSEHEVERNLNTLKLLNRDNKFHRDNRTLWITESERRTASDFLSSFSGPRIVLAPSGSRPSKNWPANYFASICDQLIRDLGAVILITGRGKLAHQQAERIASTMGDNANILSVVDKTSFGELTALIESSDLVISVDSGAAHIASYLNRPLVVLFGPGDYERWKPWHIDQSRATALKAECKCGTTLYKCKQKEHCMESIRPQQVLDAVDNILNR
jgi:ADP-heptose:LPS heptosyltransferase